MADSPHLYTPISLQVSRSVSWRGVVKHIFTALLWGPGAGRKRVRASTVFLTRFSSPPMTTSGRPLRRQNTACWENELCLINLRALSPAFLLLLLSQQMLLWIFWMGDGGSEDSVKLMLLSVDSSSTLSSLRGGRGEDQRSTSAMYEPGAKFALSWGISRTFWWTSGEGFIASSAVE